MTPAYQTHIDLLADPCEQELVVDCECAFVFLFIQNGQQ